MKLVVLDKQLEDALTLYANKYFDHFKPRKHKDYPDTIFYVNTKDEPVFQYNKKTKDAVVHIHKVFSKIKANFTVNDDQVKQFFKKWFNDTYGLKNVNPQLYSTTSLRYLKKGE
jgi:hypothetical protein